MSLLQKTSQTLAFGAFSILCMGVSAVHAAPNYAITDLGTLGGTDSYGYAINNVGQVVGQSYTTNNLGFTTFLYSNGAMTALSSIAVTETMAPGWGGGINDVGQIVGGVRTADNLNYHAGLYSAGITTDLGTLGGKNSGAYGINASGQVTGSSYLSDNQTQHAFLYSNGVMTDLGTLGGNYSRGTCINSSGQVAGYSYFANNTCHPILVTNGVMHDIETLGGDFGQAFGINASGQVTGYTYTSTSPTVDVAFLYTNGAMQNLGTLGGFAAVGLAVNDSGVVVGNDYLRDQTSRAFIYRNGQMSNLNTLIDPNSGWTLTSAEGINNSGQIVGTGKINGNVHAYLLTPIILPGAVSGVTATPISSSQITLQWNAAPNATSYYIFRGTVAGGYHAYVGTTNTTSFSDLHLQPGTSYYYIVTAVNQFGQGPKSAEVSATTVPGNPGSVTNLSATAFSSSQINLQWNATDGAASYYVFRGTTQGGLHSYVGTSNTTSYSDKPLPSGTAYYYIVIAVNAYGQGPKSAEVSGTTLPGNPGSVVNLSATPISASQINLRWNAADGAANYYIFRGPVSGGYHTYIGQSSTLSFSDKPLQPNTSYYYIVIAVNSFGQGPKSAEVMGKTLTP